jgi:hypothetical protein
VNDETAGEGAPTVASSSRGIRRRIAFGWGMVAASLAVMISLAVVALQSPPASEAGTVTAQSAPTSAGAPPPAADPKHPAHMGSPPLRITYPAIGMDQGVLPLAPDPAARASIVPPMTTDAYWLSPYGSPGSADTTYIIGHSWEGGDTAFNHLSSTAKRGDAIVITTAAGASRYSVTAVSTERKDTLKDSSIWNKVPGRLILVSCYTADLWRTNVIVTADLDSGLRGVRQTTPPA